jgi:hypothetical protein
VDQIRYEEDQRAFHQSLADRRPDGFLQSTSSSLTGVPWANGGGDAYEDWYEIATSCALDTLDAGVAAAGTRQRAHGRAAAGASGGTAGLYSARLGSPIPAPRFASWFSRPDGLTHADLLSLLAPVVRENEAVVWIRRMVLGPAEFCLQSVDNLTLPDSIHPLTVELRRL